MGSRLGPLHFRSLPSHSLLPRGASGVPPVVRLHSGLMDRSAPGRVGLVLLTEAIVSRVRMSTSELMLLVTLLAIGLTALRQRSETWAGILLLATVGMLCISVLGVLYRNGAQRAWWVGFCLFGWGYLTLISLPATRATLPTTSLLAYAHAKLEPPDFQGEIVHVTSTGTGSVRLASNSGQVLVSDEMWLERDEISMIWRGTIGCSFPDRQCFLVVGHFLFTWLAALLGAFAAGWFHRTRKVRLPHS